MPSPADIESPPISSVPEESCACCRAVGRLGSSLPLACFLLLLGVYLLSMSRVRLYLDGEDRYLLTQALIERGSVRVVREGRDTFEPVIYGLGQPLGMVPFYLVGRAAAAASPLEPGTATEVTVNLFNQFVTAATGALLCALLLRLGYSRRSVLGTVCVFGFATAAWPNARWLGNEPLAGFLLLGLLSSLDRLSRDPGRRAAMAAGVFGALAVVNNEALLPLVVVLVAWTLALLRKSGRLRAPVAATTLGLAAGGVLAALAYNAARYGSPLATGYGGDHGFSTWPYSGRPGFSTPLLVGLYGNLLSTGRSVFLYSPPLVCAAIAFPRFLRRHRLLGRLALVTAAYHLVVYSKWWCWYGGACWGNRMLLPLAPVALCALAESGVFAAGCSAARRAGVFLCIGAGVVVQFLAISVFHMGFFAATVNMAGAYENEYLIHFVPHASPLAGQWTLLRRASLADLDFALLGLLRQTPWAGALVLLLCLGLIAWGAAAARRALLGSVRARG